MLYEFPTTTMEARAMRKPNVCKTRFLVPKKLTFPSVLTKQCGVVPGMVDRWHHLIIRSQMDHYGHLEYLVLTENTYNSLET